MSRSSAAIAALSALSALSSACNETDEAAARSGEATSAETEMARAMLSGSIVAELLEAGLVNPRDRSGTAEYPCTTLEVPGGPARDDRILEGTITVCPSDVGEAAADMHDITAEFDLAIEDGDLAGWMAGEAVCGPEADVMACAIRFGQAGIDSPDRYVEMDLGEEAPEPGEGPYPDCSVDEPEEGVLELSCA